MHWENVILKNKNVYEISSTGFQDQVYVTLNCSKKHNILLARLGKNLFSMYVEGDLVAYNLSLRNILYRINSMAERLQEQ